MVQKSHLEWTSGPDCPVKLNVVGRLRTGAVLTHSAIYYDSKPRMPSCKKVIEILITGTNREETSRDKIHSLFPQIETH